MEKEASDADIKRRNKGKAPAPPSASSPQRPLSLISDGGGHPSSSITAVPKDQHVSKSRPKSAHLPTGQHDHSHHGRPPTAGSSLQATPSAVQALKKKERVTSPQRTLSPLKRSGSGSTKSSSNERLSPEKEQVLQALDDVIAEAEDSMGMLYYFIAHFSPKFCCLKQLFLSRSVSSVFDSPSPHSTRHTHPHHSPSSTSSNTSSTSSSRGRSSVADSSRASSSSMNKRRNLITPVNDDDDEYDDIEVIDLEKEVETGSPIKSGAAGVKILGDKIRDVDEDSNSVDNVPSITSGESESVGSSPKRAVSSASSASNNSR